jgi:hypothetical protein
MDKPPPWVRLLKEQTDTQTDRQTEGEDVGLCYWLLSDAVSIS